MAIKDILVHVDDGAECEARLILACQLARQHDAFLRGIYARGGHPKTIGEMASLAKQRFSDMTVDIAAAFELTDAYDRQQSAMDQLVWRARHADLTVVSQYQPTSETRAPKQMAERLLMESGRPVMIVPHAWQATAIGQRVLVAWDLGRESVRAVNDAVPLLQQADKVVLLALNPREGNKTHGKIPCNDIAQHLQHHGVTTKVQSLSVDDIDTANMLLSVAAEEGADLMVMGGYGHHRFRELILGGVTREIMQQMTVPVFMSH